MSFDFERAKLSNWAFGLGVLVLVASGVKLLFSPPIDTWVQVGLGAGILLLAAGVFLDPDRIRAALTGRQGRYGSNALVLSLAFTGCLVVLNALAVGSSQRLDLTEDRVFSLADETKLLLAGLEEPVQLIGFYTPDRSTSRDSIRPVLDEYVAESDGLVSYEFIDPRANPLAAELYGISRDGSMAVVVGDDSHVVDFPSETEITSGIVRLTNPEDRVIYFLTGHGERGFDPTDELGLGQLKSALESKNYGVEQLNLVVQPEIPGDAAALVVADPTTPFSEGEIDLIDGYLSGGGSLLAMLEPTPSSQLDPADDSLNQYLGEVWGIHARDDFIVDLDAMHPLVGLSFSYGTHSITQRLEGLLTQYPSARSIASVDGAAPNLQFTSLVLTSERSWGEIDFAGVAELDAGLDDEREVAGPLSIAASIEDRASGARIVMVGDADFAGNGAFLVGGNGDMAVNSIDWAAKQDDLIDITPRERTTRQVVPPTRSAVLMLIIGTAVVIPGGILAAGGRVWWQRRKQV